MFFVDYREDLSLEGIMEGFTEEAAVFDVYTGKPVDTSKELFYRMVRFCFSQCYSQLQFMVQ